MRDALQKAAIPHLRVTKLPLEYPERVLTNRAKASNRPVQIARPGIQWLAGLALSTHPVLDQAVLKVSVYLRIVVTPVGTDASFVSMQQIADLICRSLSFGSSAIPAILACNNSVKNNHAEAGVKKWQACQSGINAFTDPMTSARREREIHPEHRNQNS